MGVEVMSPGIVADTSDTEVTGENLVKEGDFFPFIRETIKGLAATTLGKEFLAEFDPKTAGFGGGERYPNATLVIRPPLEIKKSNMQSVAETNGLNYRNPPGSKNLVRATALKSGSKSPAMIWIFPPGVTLPANFSNGKLANVGISSGGDFMYYQALENLSSVLCHEMIHAYYMVIGEAELGTDAEDEKRAVGLYGYKPRKYSENRLRVALKQAIRLGYPRLGVVDDPELKSNPKYFDG
jgi:hypothetical protein